MRKALNENPMIQLVVIGVLVLVAGVVVATQMMGGGVDEGEEAELAQPATPATTPTTPERPATESTAPGSGAPPAAGEPAIEAGPFSPGPGLPAPVVRAHERGSTVVLLAYDDAAPVDRLTRRIASTLEGTGGVSLFQVEASGVSQYSRVMRGVELSRLPALVVISPPAASHGPLPTAEISYGFRTPRSAVQAVRDARYSGPEGLPYDPR